MKVLFVGDVHGKFLLLRDLVDSVIPDVVIQCGDFGFWPTETKRYGGHLAQLKKGFGVPCYFCDGNHEDFSRLPIGEELYYGSNVFHCKRGSVMKIGTKNIMFFGGAHSVDSGQRFPMLSIFPEENITQREVNEALEYKGTVDFIVSHTCPTLFGFREEWHDGNRYALDALYDAFKPERWFFGHFHENYVDWYEECKFYCLNKIDSPGNYVLLNM